MKLYVHESQETVSFLGVCYWILFFKKNDENSYKNSFDFYLKETGYKENIFLRLIYFFVLFSKSISPSRYFFNTSLN
jgi:hypothetical protein